MDLPRQPRALGQPRIRSVDIAEPSQLRVRPAQGAEIGGQLGQDAHGEDRVERQPERIGRGHDARRDDRVQREMELAEGRHDQPGRQERMRHEAVADVQATEQDPGDDEPHEDQDLHEGDRGGARRQGRDAWRIRVERLGSRNGRQDRLATEQHDPRQDEDGGRREFEERRRQRWRLVAQAAGGSDDQEGGDGRARDRPQIDGGSPGRVGRQPELALPAGDDDPDHHRVDHGQGDEPAALVQGDRFPAVAPSDPGQDRDAGADQRRGDVDRDVEGTRVLDAGNPLLVQTRRLSSERTTMRRMMLASSRARSRPDGAAVGDRTPRILRAPASASGERAPAG